MTPQELQKVLNEHATYERNRDSVCVFLGGLILLSVGALVYIAKWAIGKAKNPAYKPPCKPRAPVITQRYRK